ncbi:MAG: hypothetical protein K9L60_10995 [Methylovulum sp.]|jgi:hypothetical protein|nr:hypothetical protein [Methylovulum sp.]MCF7999761.1 hypothetical protein [Methylovulum sp.]
MKEKSSQPSKKSARKPTGTVKMTPTARGLTSQAGLIPIVKFLDHIGFEQTVSQYVPHQRGIMPSTYSPM